MKRSALKRKTALVSRTPLRSRAPLKAKKRRTWPSPKEMGRTVCEVQLDERCTKVATESHHRILRSRGGADDPSNLVACDRYCHQYLHTHVAEATELGFMGHEWER